MNWHHLTVEEIYILTQSSPTGLSSKAVARKIKESGPNKLIEKKRKSAVSIFFSQFRDLMILILLAASLIAGFIGDLTDTIVILLIVVVNAIIGFLQEFRAGKAIEALKKISVAMARVLRDEKIVNIPASELVPGDIICLETGNAVPADLRISESVNLKIDESALTGESFPAEKSADTMPAGQQVVADRHNMAYKGTYVSYGRGTGIVVATGMQTELGHIAEMLQGEVVLTPLQARLASFGKKLSAIILLLCVIFFISGWIRGEETVKLVLTSISLAVAAIPEALPAVVTISLALAAKRLVRYNSLIRNLHAVETLGSVTYICTDKTGTLTKNKMSVEEIYVDGNEYTRSSIPVLISEQNNISLLLQFCALNNDAGINETGMITGDPTEAALLEIAMANNIKTDKLNRLAEIPFDPGRKMMTTFHQWHNKFISVTKGAPDILVTRCENADTNKVLQELEKIAMKGQRVIGFAFRIWDKIPEMDKNVETQLYFTGMVGLLDPPREEVYSAVEECKTAGIVPVIITGDHPLTAQNIAKRIGIISGIEDRVITGKELADLTEENFMLIIDKIKVYARVSPEQKLRIIKGLQKKGQFVAMAGDGINDAPSLKRANIGVAMGITGTDVSKEAADIILLDDNFNTIIKAVKQGRRIYDNILKFIKYLMTTNSSELWTLLIAPLIGLPIPLLPIHILWINLVSDGLPAISLSFEKAETNIMKRPPRPPRESVFSEGRALHILWVGILMAGLALTLQSWSISNGLHWQTMTFTILSFMQLTHLIVVRSEKYSVFQIGLFSNKVLLFSFLFSFILQMMVVYVPFLNPVFKTHPLSIYELSLCLIGSLIIFIAVELEKLIKRSVS